MYSDPYVKISIEGAEMEVYPHFVSLDDDEFPQVYKTSVVSKVLFMFVVYTVIKTSMYAWYGMHVHTYTWHTRTCTHTYHYILY